MRIVFMGTPDFAVPSLRALLDAGHEIAAVFTQPDKPQGRKQVLTPPPIKVAAREYGLPVFQPHSLKEEKDRIWLRALAPALIVVVAYGKLLPKEVLDLPTHGCINVHGSLLPRWRGAAPIQWSVLAGDRTAGVTTMRMNQGLDTGDILLKYQTEIGARETAGELFDRLAVQGAALLIQTIDRLSTITPTPQDDSQSCYAPMLDKQKAVIDWNKSAEQIDCLVRGMNPWPIALTQVGSSRLKIFSATPVQGSGRAGEVLSADDKHGVVVACGMGALRLDEVQPEGKKRMKATDFVRGRALAPGTILGE